jgi:16S rRNA processing protein RimM
MSKVSSRQETQSLSANSRFGVVRRPHGIRGALRVEPLLPGAPKLARGIKLYRESDGALLTVLDEVRTPDGILLLQTNELHSRNDAEEWRDQYLLVDEGDLPRDESPFLLTDLVGLRAVLPNGESLGTVTDVESYGGNNVMVVNDVQRFPVVDAFIKEVSIPRGEVVVTPWEEA